MMRRQEIGSVILGEIVQESAGADPPPIIVEHDSSNCIFLDVAVA
jgi:hypothetical protein